MDMQYAWRVPQNTICFAVKEVCQAIVEEYKDELMTCPTSLDGWRKIAGDIYSKWNFPHCLGALNGKHVAMKESVVGSRPTLGSTIRIGGRKLHIYLG